MTDIAIRVDNLSKLSHITEPTSGPFTSRTQDTFYA